MSSHNASTSPPTLSFRLRENFPPPAFRTHRRIFVSGICWFSSGALRRRRRSLIGAGSVVGCDVIIDETFLRLDRVVEFQLSVNCRGGGAFSMVNSCHEESTQSSYFRGCITTISKRESCGLTDIWCECCYQNAINYVVNSSPSLDRPRLFITLRLIVIIVVLVWFWKSWFHNVLLL